MRKLDSLIILGLLLLAGTARGDLPRHPVVGPPRTATGVVDRFLVLRKQLILHDGEGVLSGIVALQGGVLFPVSEDRDSIYYQSPNGVWTFDPNAFTPRLPLGGLLHPGGLCFSKTNRNDVCAYLGDARKQKDYLQRDSRLISPRALAELKVGHLAARRPTDDDRQQQVEQSEYTVARMPHLAHDAPQRLYVACHILPDIRQIA